MNDVLLKPAPGCFCGDCFSRKCDPPFKRWGLFWKVPLIHFDLNPEDPLTFCTSDTKEYIRPDRHMDSDGGSIPPPAQSLPFFDLSPFLYLWSYYNHDSAYRYGGWYTLRDGVWIFVLAPRDRVDEVCLHQMIRAEGGDIISQCTVHRAVRMFGWIGCWNEKDQVKCREKDGVVVSS